MKQQLHKHYHQPQEHVIFDRTAVSKRLLDDEEMLLLIARTFIDDMKQQMEAITTLVAEGNIEQIAQQAHKIKGSSANMGGMVLSELAQSIEMAGKATDMETIHQQLPKLQQSFIILKQEIEAELF